MRKRRRPVRKHCFRPYIFSTSYHGSCACPPTQKAPNRQRRLVPPPLQRCFVFVVAGGTHLEVSHKRSRLHCLMFRLRSAQGFFPGCALLYPGTELFACGDQTLSENHLCRSIRRRILIFGSICIKNHPVTGQETRPSTTRARCHVFAPSDLSSELSTLFSACCAHVSPRWCHIVVHGGLLEKCGSHHGHAVIRKLLGLDLLEV